MCGTKVTLARLLCTTQMLEQPQLDQGQASGVVGCRASSRGQGRAFGSGEQGPRSTREWPGQRQVSDSYCTRRATCAMVRGGEEKRYGMYGWSPGGMVSSISMRPSTEGGEEARRKGAGWLSWTRRGDPTYTVHALGRDIKKRGI